MFKSKDLLYHSIAILTVIIWGTTFVSTKILINTGLSPVEILLYRFVLAYFCILTIAHRRLWANCVKDEIRNIDEIMECYSTGGIYDFFVKVVLKDLDAYNQFVFEKLTKVHGIVKMQSSFVLNEIKNTTVLNIPKNS